MSEIINAHYLKDDNGDKISTVTSKSSVYDLNNESLASGEAYGYFLRDWSSSNLNAGTSYTLDIGTEIYSKQITKSDATHLKINCSGVYFISLEIYAHCIPGTSNNLGRVFLRLFCYK